MFASVCENHLSVEQMATRAITPAGIIADMEAGHLCTWVAEADGGEEADPLDIYFRKRLYDRY